MEYHSNHLYFHGILTSLYYFTPCHRKTVANTVNAAGDGKMGVSSMSSEKPISEKLINSTVLYCIVLLAFTRKIV